jgi:pilus assembly protein CpaB
MLTVAVLVLPSPTGEPMAQQNSGPLRALIFLTLAMVAGGASIVVLTQLIQSYQNQIENAKRPEDTVMVVVAARDLYQGVTVTEQDLYMVEIPPRYLPEGVFLSPEHVIGRIPRERILSNEFVRSDRLADPESGTGLNAIIPRGMRAISIRLKDGYALSGLLNPLNYVDVLVTVQTGEEEEDVETRTLLQAVFVLGVNSRMHRESRQEAREKRGQQEPAVTLLVNAEQAEMLSHAERMGRLRLTLRNDLDINYVDSAGIDINALRTMIRDATPKEPERKNTRAVVAAPSASPASPNTFDVQIIRGSTKKVLKVDDEGTVIDAGGRKR